MIYGELLDEELDTDVPEDVLHGDGLRNRYRRGIIIAFEENEVPKMEQENGQIEVKSEPDDRLLDDIDETDDQLIDDGTVKLY